MFLGIICWKKYQINNYKVNKPNIANREKKTMNE